MTLKEDTLEAENSVLRLIRPPTRSAQGNTNIPMFPRVLIIRGMQAKAETTMQEQVMKLFPILFAITISTTLGAAFAQETSTSGANAETAPAPEIEACRASGLIALKERSAAVKDVSLDLDSVRLIKVNSKIENIDIKAIVLGDANIEKKKSDKTQNFICIVGEKGKVLLTIFSDQ